MWFILFTFFNRTVVSIKIIHRCKSLDTLCYEISVRLAEDPVFYQRLSERLNEIIEDRRLSRLEAIEAIKRLQTQGATRFVYTNVDRDGMLEGPDLDEVRRISETVRGRFLYSGGIGSVEDLKALRALRLVNLAGVISGKALYEHRFTVGEGKQALA